MAAALAAEAPGTAWIVATGTVTNVGALFRKHPELVAHIKGLSVMGGAIGDGFSDAPMGEVDGKPRIGNWTPWAEFNIVVDPEAAAEIFGNKEIASKTTLIPLDLTHQCLATSDVRELLLHGKGGEKGGSGKTTLRTMLVELLYFFAKTYSYVYPSCLTSLQCTCSPRTLVMFSASPLARHFMIRSLWQLCLLEPKMRSLSSTGTPTRAQAPSTTSVST